MVATRKRSAPKSKEKAAPAPKSRRIASQGNQTVEASIVMEVVVGSDEEVSESDSEDESGSHSSTSSRASNAAATVSALPNPSPSRRRNVSMAVLNTTSPRTKYSQSSSSKSRNRNSTSSEFTVVEKKSTRRASATAKKEVQVQVPLLLPEIPAEQTASRQQSSTSTGSDDEASSQERDLDETSITSITSSVSISLNPYTDTALDDEQVISFALDAGILSQCQRVCICAAKTLAAPFLLVPLICYALGGKANAQIGVVFLLIYLVIVALVVLFSLPFVLLQRILSRLSAGKQAELEMLCLVLSVLVMACVSIVYRLLRAERCGILWCEGSGEI